ncbi:uncharacterized protein LOC112902199 isoform X2 [Panicum hallii]|uniref:uncharacterized protein LOC112902199 isoform X2 n=1 Tax=Panicum hallii TaxID=206008 RepID=UPI000DF4EDD2|nr:uncharacterized protein LOC112902199 isoform X2 [Panicum hallii]
MAAGAAAPPAAAFALAPACRRPSLELFASQESLRPLTTTCCGRVPLAGAAVKELGAQTAAPRDGAAMVKRRAGQSLLCGVYHCNHGHRQAVGFRSLVGDDDEDVVPRRTGRAPVGGVCVCTPSARQFAFTPASARLLRKCDHLSCCGLRVHSIADMVAEFNTMMPLQNSSKQSKTEPDLMRNGVELQRALKLHRSCASSP